MEMNNFFRRFAGLAAKIILVMILLVLVLGGAALLAYQNTGFRSWVFNRKLNAMPYADYTPLVHELYAEERYDEASMFSTFVLSHPDMPQQAAFAELRAKIDEDIRRNKSPLKRGAAFLSGFFSGGGTAAEARLGGLVANLLTGKGGAREGDSSKRVKDDADNLADALEGARFGSGKMWFPEAIRLLRRSNLISPAYEGFLLKHARESAEKGAADSELQSAAASTQALVAGMGLSRALGIYIKVRNDEDIEQLAMWSRRSPDETYIVAMLGGIDLFHLLPDTAEGRVMLTEIAKKGERGVRSALFWLR